ncbi:MAG: hypothetical protein ABIN96_00990, partial [Rubrivivax sp.]
MTKALSFTALSGCMPAARGRAIRPRNARTAKQRLALAAVACGLALAMAAPAHAIVGGQPTASFA